MILSFGVNTSFGVQVVTCLLLNSAMAQGFELLLAAESFGGEYYNHIYLLSHYNDHDDEEVDCLCGVDRI